ncbi:MAG: CRISPR-associated nuclease/helicase Cas3 [Methanoregula sp. PtaU1.Bin006]|nr:MAG: CRISPR-associated nuclease/helicase Cas3 [Methanoregula sp. PtaB.Bin085]OPY35334.1 MAG: CRISPR-associated nuclease/helicase Cas3 [Methanoregula sp. PtaU1.Bin006]
MYYAHSTKNSDKSDWQPLKDHLKNVAELSRIFANDFNAGDLAYMSGLLHDLGKYSSEFQRRLEGQKISVDHSTAGSLEAIRLFDGSQKSAGLLFAYIISGHHGGMLNFGSAEGGLCERLQKQELPDYSAFRKDITLDPERIGQPKLHPLPKKTGFCISFFTRMLYSCLVDADSLDTEKFYDSEKSSLRTQCDSMEELAKRFESFMREKNAGVDDSLINRERKKIFRQCVDAGSLPPGIFSLTVPTGGGKTLSSMAFALEHLKKNNLKRIFYVIPYTSIIEQNAKVFRDIFGTKNVLEHHSNFDPETLKKFTGDPISEALMLATENWDMPIVVTTNVQFFESLFSNKRSRTRKLHNLVKSVIILDEAQMLPTGYLLPCLAALSELVRNYSATVVICTATQPRLGDLLDKTIPPREIMHDPERLYETFRRVNVTNLGSLSDAELAERLDKQLQVLCVVNTRTHAKKLYDALKKTGTCHHLSARMCPVHRRKKLEEIRTLLKDGKECRVISTQLIEAGVDIDFPVVYRAMTGVDSLAQAAGRCNREGKLPEPGKVFLFKSVEKHGKATSWQSLVAEIGEMTLAGSVDPLSLDTVADYFRRLYHYKEDGGLDEKTILPKLEDGSRELAFPFEDIADAFRIIEEGTKDVIIPFDDYARLKIAELRSAEFPGKYLRDLQGYTVSIFANEFRELERNHAIEILAERFFVLRSCEDYSDETGLKPRQDAGYDGSLLNV